MFSPRSFFTACAIATLLTSCKTSTSLPATNPSNYRAQSEYGDRSGPRNFRTVILDAGHGGRDSGAICPSTGATEKNLALSITHKTAAILRRTHNVILMRNGDEFIDLDERVNRANHHSDAVLVSVHLNHSGSSAQGAETYWWRTDSYSLAKRTQQKLSAVTGVSGSRGMVRRRLRLTRNPRIPCILVECGYLSNPAEAARLTSSAYQNRMAQAIASAILETSQQGDLGMTPIPAPLIAPPSRPTDPADS